MGIIPDRELYCRFRTCKFISVEISLGIDEISLLLSMDNLVSRVSAEICFGIDEVNLLLDIYNFVIEVSEDISLEIEPLRPLDSRFK